MASFLSRVFEPEAEGPGSQAQPQPWTGPEPVEPGNEGGDGREIAEGERESQAGEQDSYAGSTDLDANVDLAVTVRVEASGSYEDMDGTTHGWSHADEIALVTSTDALLANETSGSSASGDFADG